ncbi:MAG: SagB/ThcOx family dehydrogenase [Dehalococcoidia bacterium]|jgi:SagB-type dehydrogenase family enzyme
MNITRFACLALLLIGFSLFIPSCAGIVTSTAQAPTAPTDSTNPADGSQANIKLPEPRLKSDVSLEEALSKRRSIRAYADAPLTLNDISQLLWAGQGITDSSGKRTAPSAMASYPLTLYLVAGNVEGLGPGIYTYQPDGHELARVKDGDYRESIGNQSSIQTAPIDIVIAAHYDKLKTSGDTGQKWAYLEGGHVAQNICLEATALNLGTVTVGGITEDQVKNVIGLAGNTGVLYVLPVGKKP